MLAILPKNIFLSSKSRLNHSSLHPEIFIYGLQQGYLEEVSSIRRLDGLRMNTVLRNTGDIHSLHLPIEFIDILMGPIVRKLLGRTCQVLN